LDKGRKSDAATCSDNKLKLRRNKGRARGCTTKVEPRTEQSKNCIDVEKKTKRIIVIVERKEQQIIHKSKHPPLPKEEVKHLQENLTITMISQNITVKGKDYRKKKS